MSGFPVAVGLKFGAEKVSYADDRGRALGTLGIMADGRTFRWSRAGTSALASGDVCQARVINNATHSVGQLISTVGASGNTLASGGTTVPVIWAATPHAASGVYKDGYMAVETTPGAGTYRIASDPSSAASGGNSLIILAEDDPLKVALSTVSRLAFHGNPWNAVIQAPVPLTNRVVGVVPGGQAEQVAANQYFWLQVRGPCAVRYNATQQAAVAGREVVPDTSVAGAVGGYPSSSTGLTTGGAFTQQINMDLPRIGIVYDGVPDDADLIVVDLKIE